MADPLAISLAHTALQATDSASTSRGPFSRLEFERVARIVIAERPSRLTRTAYTHELDTWLAFCDMHHLNPSTAPLAAAVAFRDALQRLPGRAGKPRALASVRRSLAALASIYGRMHYGSGGHGVTTSPFHPKALTWPAGSTFGRTEAIADAIAEAMLDVAAQSPRDLAILRLLYDTGLRRASIASARRENLRGTSLIVIVKGGREAEAQLPDLTLRALRAWLAIAPASPWIFPARRPAEAIDPIVINQVVTKFAEKVGAFGVHPHQFRARFATTALDADVPIYQVQAAMHHRDSATTQRYDRGARGGTVAATVAAHRAKKNR